MVRTRLIILLTLAAILWGWNAGMAVRLVFGPGAQAPGAAVPCGPDCQMVSGPDRGPSDGAATIVRGAGAFLPIEGRPRPSAPGPRSTT